MLGGPPGVGGDGHIEGAAWSSLDNFKVAPPEIDRDVPMAVHCKGKYRRMIACSLLQRAVFQNVVNVIEASTRGRKPNFLWLRRPCVRVPGIGRNLEPSRW